MVQVLRKPSQLDTFFYCLCILQGTKRNVKGCLLKHPRRGCCQKLRGSNKDIALEGRDINTENDTKCLRTQKHKEMIQKNASCSLVAF